MVVSGTRANTGRQILTYGFFLCIAYSVLTTAILGHYINQKGGLEYILEKFGLGEPVIPRTAMYQEQLDRFPFYPDHERDIVFVGDSWIASLNWSEYYTNIRNRGVGSDTSAGVVARLQSVRSMAPRKVFLGIGTNDLAQEIEPGVVAQNIRRVALSLQEDGAEVYVMSVLPINLTYDNQILLSRKSAQILELNRLLESQSRTSGYTFLDNYRHFTDSQGNLQERYITDGLHLTEAGNARLAALIRPHMTMEAQP